jgi:site-specific recombinase XerD
MTIIFFARLELSKALILYIEQNEYTKMRIQKVTNIEWQGGRIHSYTVLKSGPLDNDSIIVPPSLYLLRMAKSGACDNTCNASAKDLKLYFETLSDFGIDWRDVTDNQMSGYLEKILQSKRDLCAKSVRRHVATLRSFYKSSEDCGLINDPVDYTFDYYPLPKKNNPRQAGKKKKFNLREQYVSDAIFEIILGSIRAGSKFVRLRDELVLLLGKDCGLRTSEITSNGNLQTKELKERLEQADAWGSLTITVPIIGKGDKIRHVEFPPIVTNKIIRFLNESRNTIPDGYLVCSSTSKALSKSHATRVFRTAKGIALPIIKKEIKTAVNIAPPQYTISFKAAEKLVFHSLRHSYATNLVDYCYQIGIDPYQYIPEQMGHSDEATTKEYILFEANIYNRDSIRKRLSNLVEE